MVVGAGLLVVGCVSKSDHGAVVAQLDECRNDKVAAQDAAKACESRYAREVTRFQDMDAVLEQVIPETMEEFRGERDRIAAMVPVQVQEEVASFMEKFSNAVASGFSVLRQDNQQMVAELAAAREELSRLGVSAETLQDRVDTIKTSLDDQAATRHQAAAIAEVIQDFDQAMILCKDCKDRLRLNRHEREVISNFHAELVGRLSELQAGRTASVAAGGEPTEEPGR